MHFTQAVTIFISCELTPSMVDMLMTVAPGLQTGIDAVLISINQCAWINRIWLLLDSRVVDVPMTYNPTFVILSSLKPLFFNSLTNKLCCSVNVGA